MTYLDMLEKGLILLSYSLKGKLRIRIVTASSILFSMLHGYFHLLRIHAQIPLN